MKTLTFTLEAIVATALIGLSPFEAKAGCARCGCDANCNVYCRKVCDTKKVEITCWSSECEQVCLAAKPDPCPLAHLLGAGKCGGCGACDGCTSGCTDGGCPSGVKCTCGPEATCAKVRNRKKLMRRTIEVDVPVVKWVVEPLCNGCAEGCDPCTDPAAMQEAGGGAEEYEVPGTADSLPSARHVPGNTKNQSYAGIYFAPSERLANPGNVMPASATDYRQVEPVRLEPATFHASPAVTRTDERSPKGRSFMRRFFQ